jgi:hypothetical protein
MKKTSPLLVLFLSVVAAAAGLGQAPTASPQPVKPDPLSRLGADLTPVGAERAGNADGSIPAWTGGLPKRSPIDPAVGYVDPFANDEPLYTITAANAAQYKDVLSAGHLALLTRDARTLRMRVYPTLRSAAYPDAVLAEVKKQAPLVSTDGYHVRNVGRSSVPFPIPADALQVMWNHVFRWRGGSVERQYIVAPVSLNGQFFVVRIRESAAFDQQGFMVDSQPDRLFNNTKYFMSPPSALGMRTLTWEPIDPMSEDRVHWVYLPQTLDARRWPAYGYDMKEGYTSGLQIVDQVDGWNGAPDRFEWKLLGKRELIIGYNAYRLADRSLRYADIIRPHHLDPDLLRYERHRVWVVEATARKYHAFHRRVFYVDEDTWQVAQEEVYDKQGQLTRFGDHHMIQFDDVQVPWYAATIHHSVKAGAYLVSYLSNAEPFQTRWGFKGRIADYVPSSLRLHGLQ